MRLNKFISEAGRASRRGADKLIEEGRVMVNGKKAKIGTQVNPGDTVFVDGNELYVARNNVYIALNKPVGITSTTEKGVKGNIADLVNHTPRVFNVGRLDKDSEGLILMTNDGDIVNEILRSEGRHEKEYVVSVDRPITPEFIKGMSEGVRILGTKTLPCEIEQLSKYDFKIILTQGLNRQIRRMMEAFGHEVTLLHRKSFGCITDKGLKMGEYRRLKPFEVKQLRSLAESGKLIVD